jgi:hypothetical protein
VLVEAVEQLAGGGEEGGRVAGGVAAILHAGEVGESFGGGFPQVLRIGRERLVAGDEFLVGLEQGGVSGGGGEVAAAGCGRPWRSSRKAGSSIGVSSAMLGFSGLMREKPQRLASSFSSISCSREITGAGMAP